MSKKKHTENDSSNDKWKKFTETQPDQIDGASLGEEAGSESVKADDEGLYGLDYPSRDTLEDQLTAMERKVDEYKAHALRAKADLDNVQKRAERDVSNAHKYGNEKLLSELLPVLDSLTRGLEGSLPESDALQNMRQGMVLTADLFEKVLMKFGVQMVNPDVGEAFNPEMHEAMSMVPSTPEVKPNAIVQVLQRGYVLNGRVLRAAMVIVSR